MTRRNFTLELTAMVMAAAAALQARPSNDLACIEGYVLDHNRVMHGVGLGVPFATVVLTYYGHTLTTTTDATGYYRISGVPLGTKAILRCVKSPQKQSAPIVVVFNQPWKAYNFLYRSHFDA